MVIPGAVLGGLAYRSDSKRRNMPVDATATGRRYTYAVLALLVPTAITALGTGMRAQGVPMTLLAFLIGGAVALGILVSGDRRDL